MKHLWRVVSNLVVVVFLVGVFASCDNGGGGGGKPDVGDNDANVVLCVGDSITQGRCAPAGAPYPSRLASLSGKKVINSGVCGAIVSEIKSRAFDQLAKQKPGYLCLMIGANDASRGTHVEDYTADLRSIVQRARAQKTVVLLATITPTDRGHEYSNHGVDILNTAVRQVAKEEGAKLVDINKEFGDDPSLLQSDGLHPSDAGTQLIALAFNDKI